MNPIWKIPVDLETLNNMSTQSLVGTLGIEFTAFGPDWLEGTMPVDHRTVQPFGILHGGASVALAESLGSIASSLCLENPGEFIPVGLEINANHLNSVSGGFVTGTVKHVKIGRTIHVWNIEIRDESGKLCCVSRLTTAITKRK